MLLVFSEPTFVYVHNDTSYDSMQVQSTTFMLSPTTLALCTSATTQHGVNTTGLISGTLTTIASE